MCLVGRLEKTAQLLENLSQDYRTSAMRMSDLFARAPRAKAAAYETAARWIREDLEKEAVKAGE